MKKKEKERKCNAERKRSERERYTNIGRAFRARGLGDRDRDGEREREGERKRERTGRKEERDRMKRIERPFKGEIRGVARERRVLYGDPSSGFYDGVTPP